jgi:hypothetical protein
MGLFDWFRYKQATERLPPVEDYRLVEEAELLAIREEWSRRTSR